jgi:hypothetical protein
MVDIFFENEWFGVNGRGLALLSLLPIEKIGIRSIRFI